MIRVYWCMLSMTLLMSSGCGPTFPSHCYEGPPLVDTLPVPLAHPTIEQRARTIHLTPTSPIRLVIFGGEALGKARESPGGSLREIG